MLRNASVVTSPLHMIGCTASTKRDSARLNNFNTDDLTHIARRRRIYAYLRYRHRKIANLKHALNHLRSFRSIKLEQH